MAPFNLTWLLCLFVISTSASSIVGRHAFLSCPHDCKCVTNQTTLITTYHCASLDFINKTSSNEIAGITSLDISNISLHTFDKRLKSLINLERLNLAHNKLTDLKHFPRLSKITHLNLRANQIKSFSAKHLPLSLISLDISRNYIRELPRDILRLPHLNHVAIYENSFSCNRESLEVRDILVENEVKIVGQATCDEPENFKGQSWFHVLDLDEFFKIHDQEGMQADEPEGSGDIDGSGDENLIDSGMIFPETTTEEQIIQQKIVPQEAERPKIESTSAEPETTTADDIYFDASGDDETEIIDGVKGVDPSPNGPIRVVTAESKEGTNLGTNIFLGVFLLCLVTLLIYAIKKNRERKRETRRKKRQEAIKQRAAAMEMMPKNPKPSDKQNGNSENVPLMNGQNGNSKPTEDIPAADQPLLENEPVIMEPNGDYHSPTTPLFPNSDVKSVKVKAAEIPDSVPQTPILVSRSRTSDGSLIVTPKNS